MSDPAYICAQYNSNHQYLLKSKDRFDAEPFVDSQPAMMKFKNTLYRPIPTVSGGGVPPGNPSKWASNWYARKRS